VPGDSEHPGKSTLDKHWRLDLLSEKPVKLNLPLFFIFLLQDLLRACELFVARHLVDSSSKVLREKRNKTDRVEAFRLILGSELESDRWIRAHLANRSPEREVLVSFE
jgi:hypothetical protein